MVNSSAARKTPYISPVTDEDIMMLDELAGNVRSGSRQNAQAQNDDDMTVDLHNPPEPLAAPLPR